VIVRRPIACLELHVILHTCRSDTASCLPAQSPLTQAVDGFCLAFVLLGSELCILVLASRPHSLAASTDHTYVYAVMQSTPENAEKKQKKKKKDKKQAE